MVNLLFKVVTPFMTVDLKPYSFRLISKILIVPISCARLIQSIRKVMNMSDDDQGVEGEESGFNGEESATRGRLEVIIPKLVKKAIAQGVEVLSDEKTREKVVNEVVRRAIDKGGEVVDVTEDSLKRMLGELQAGRELTDKMISRLDDAKVEVGKAVRDEIKGFFSQVEVSQEMRKVMDGMTMDIHTQIRFRFDESAESDAPFSASENQKEESRVDDAPEGEAD